jgi:hypothetical protein
MAGGQRGRKSKLTEVVAEVIIEQLRQGHYRQTAAALAGIHPTTFSDWMGLQREPYLSFQERVREAEADAERIQLAKITESPEPADAKWYLARKFPDKWAETRRVDVSGRLDMGIKLNASALSSDQAREHIQGLTDWLFTDGDDSANGTSESGEQ